MVPTSSDLQAILRCLHQQIFFADRRVDDIQSYDIRVDDIQSYDILMISAAPRLVKTLRGSSICLNYLAHGLSVWGYRKMPPGPPLCDATHTIVGALQSLFSCKI